MVFIQMTQFEYVY